jgi:orotidine-5'-phosphate decarboxylase
MGEGDMAKRFDDVERKLDRIDKLLRGNGAVGLVTEVDRLKQAEKVRCKFLWIILGVVVTQAAHTIAQYFS